MELTISDIARLIEVSVQEVYELICAGVITLDVESVEAYRAKMAGRQPLQRTRELTCFLQEEGFYTAGSLNDLIEE